MKKISLVMEYRDNLPYSDVEFNGTIASLVQQNYDNWELLVADHRGKSATTPVAIKDPRIVHVPGPYKNRAQALNAAIARATVCASHQQRRCADCVPPQHAGDFFDGR